MCSVTLHATTHRQSEHAELDEDVIGSEPEKLRHIGSVYHGTPDVREIREVPDDE